MRLQKYLASCGVASRREAEGLIEAGRIEVNGSAAHIGQSIDPDTDKVTFDGRAVREDAKVYILLNKPRGVVTTAKDTHDRKTVVELLGGISERLFPVGRLDMDVQGALLLTNDGELAHRLMHPRFEIDKVYLAWVKGILPIEIAMRLERGIELEDGITAPAEVRILQTGEHDTLIRLTIHEGRNREVKRMCTAVGHPVRSLQRISVGGVQVKGLQPGQWRYLSEHEIAHLRALTQLAET